VLILTRADVEALLEPGALIDALAHGFAEYAAGRAHVPPRAAVPVSDDGVLLVMPADAVTDAGLALGTKLVTLYTGNQARGVPTIHGTYVLMDGRTGVPLGFMDAGYLTGLRTGATSALAARHLARRDARTVLCFGAGVQAGFQLLCLAAELPIERVEVVGRDPARARRFAETWTTRLGRPVTVTNDPAAAVERADVITCATTATTPLFDGRRLAPGAHVDGVGTFQPTARELDTETIRRARVVVDQAATIDNAGDVAIPITEGAIARAHVVGELAAVVSGAVAGRTRADEITVFKSEGFALEDLVAAQLAYTLARARGVGRDVALA
jgi:ornithine cyclodeaminase/alanine dehydrogenase-like protein (mu-crystallin family)